MNAKEFRNKKTLQLILVTIVRTNGKSQEAYSPLAWSSAILLYDLFCDNFRLTMWQNTMNNEASCQSLPMMYFTLSDLIISDSKADTHFVAPVFIRFMVEPGGLAFKADDL